MNKIKICGMELPVYLAVTALVTFSMCMGWLPGGMLGALILIVASILIKILF